MREDPELNKYNLNSKNEKNEKNSVEGIEVYFGPMCLTVCQTPQKMFEMPRFD